MLNTLQMWTSAHPTLSTTVPKIAPTMTGDIPVAVILVLQPSEMHVMVSLTLISGLDLCAAAQSYCK